MRNIGFRKSFWYLRPLTSTILTQQPPIFKEAQYLADKKNPANDTLSASFTFTNFSSNNKILLLNLLWMTDTGTETTTGVRAVVTSARWGGVEFTPFFAAQSPAGTASPESTIMYITNPDLTSQSKLEVKWNGIAFARSLELLTFDNVDILNPLVSGTRRNTGSSIFGSTVSALGVSAYSYLVGGHGFQGYDGLPVAVSSIGWTTRAGVTTSASTTTDMAFIFGRQEVTSAGNYDFDVRWNLADGIDGYIYSIRSYLPVQYNPVILDRRSTVTKVSPTGIAFVSAFSLASVSSNYSLLLVNLQWFPEVAVETVRARVSAVYWGGTPMTEIVNAVGSPGSNSPDTASFYLKKPTITASDQLVVAWTSTIFSWATEIVLLDKVDQSNPATGTNYSNGTSLISSTVSSSFVPANSLVFAGQSIQGYDTLPVTVSSNSWSSFTGVTTSASTTTDIGYVFSNLAVSSNTSNLDHEANWLTADGVGGYMVIIKGANY